MKENVLAGIAFCLLPSLWGMSETVVNRYGRVDLGTAPVASDDVVFVDSGVASVTLSGASPNPVPLGNFFPLGSGFELGILGNDLVLTTGTDPDYLANPPEVLNAATIWLEAGKNCSTNAVGDVTAWYDAREESAAAVKHGYAAALADVVAGTQSGPSLSVRNGRTAVAFRAYVGSTNIYRSLELRTPGGAASTLDMYDGFYVVTPRGGSPSENQHAPILGNKSEGYFFSGNKGTGAMLSEEGNALWKAYACTYRHNGAEADPTEPVDGNACHVCEFSVYNTFTIPIDSLLRDRNLASGGVYLHEVLIFTRRLTAVERMQVTAYLMQKWNVARGKVSVNGADGAVVKASDTILDRIQLVGDVALGPLGSSITPSLQYGARDQKKRYRLEASGGVLNAQGTEYALKLADGDAITIDDSTTTNRVVRNVGGPAGRISISGARRATIIDQVPETRLAASSSVGDIVLRSRTKTASPYVRDGSAAAVLSATSVDIPAGTGGATVTVTIPTSGDWEVEFDIQNAAAFKEGGAWTSGGKVSYRVSLVDHLDLLNKIALTVDPAQIGDVIPHRRYLIRGLAAGTYTLKFAGYSTATFKASVKNLAFAFVPNPESEQVVPMTEGDFDSMAMNKPYFQSRDNLVANTYTQWTIANGTNINPNPIVQAIVNSMMGNAATSTGYDFSFRAHELGRYGDNALMWIHTNSTVSAVRNTATSPATILPAGTWRLRMKACRMTTGPTDFSSRVGKNPEVNNTRCGKTLAKYQAKVRVDGGSPLDLGVTGEVDSFIGKTYYFPNSFTVSEGARVVVDLDQLVGWSFSLTDDYEFVKVENSPVDSAGLGPELIANGSFEKTDVWIRDDYDDGSVHRVDFRSPVDGPYGATYCDGGYVARSFSGARCYQPIDLEQGVYRLSYWSRARCDYVYGNPKGLPGTPCRLHFWYVAEGASDTNHVVSGDTLWCTNFYETTALFRVKAAGRYLFGFNADPKLGSASNDSLTDCVSVRKVLDTSAVPDIDPNADLTFTPANGKVRLDFPGMLSVKQLLVNGHRLYGEVSAETHPGLFAGPGTVNVTGAPRGTMIICR